MNLKESFRLSDSELCSLFFRYLSVVPSIWRMIENVRPCSPCDGSLAERNALLSLRRRCATTGFSRGKIKRTTHHQNIFSFLLHMYFYAFLLLYIFCCLQNIFFTQPLQNKFIPSFGNKQIYEITIHI